MREIDLYEKKILSDEELPVQLNINEKAVPDSIYENHWHEHLELHYLLQGEADMKLDQTCCHLQPGQLLIINSNELHAGTCTRAPYKCCVIIFEIADLSPELARQNFIFQNLIDQDTVVSDLVLQIFKEYHQQKNGYKQCCRSLVMLLLVHLCRHYALQSLPERESRKRKMALEKLNIVLSYMEKHMDEPISNQQLADLICLSEDRFGHLFKEKIGKPPMKYLNDIRLKKAATMLKTDDSTIAEVADAVGFQDYNNFGRLFKKQFGCTPYDVKTGVIPS